ncbi:S-adenosyl-L-methionine-dependent methyltransferase [Calycina marina]|uniref:tRNA N(3)-methylcytidine methyltransferase n=1 Tax=Calycina marina TaxID=1763456 RepID=A0A9P7Z1N2_9HELO|nr:S-adenosyl-L-methionine-dependent methyltransferase [Calycina marina]
MDSVNKPTLVNELSSLQMSDSLKYAQPSDQATQNIAPHLSHDPENNGKKTDPFQFGSRLLGEQDNVFEFNAWDHVETDDTYKMYAELQYAKQREAPVSDFDKNRFNADPVKWWNNFYKNNTANFFKDRKWLQQEFPILSQVTSSTAPPTTLLEVGAGAGNTAFPILKANQNPNLKIHACDFSKKAVEVIRANEAYDDGVHVQADVWDIAGDELPPGLGEESVNVVLLIFIFSALSPSQWAKAVSNVYKVLKPNGEVLFRDYGRGDLAQVRFKKGRYLEENFYIRGDGTRVYFFEKDELIKIWSGVDSFEQEASHCEDTGFEVIDLGVDRRLLVNRAKQLKMYRCWMQGRFRKHEKPAPG